MLLRALVFYLAIFPVCADTEVIEYLIPEEVMGVYQSPYAFHGIDASIGIIDRVVLAAIGNADVKLMPKVMPAYRARYYARSNPDKNGYLIALVEEPCPRAWPNPLLKTG